MEGIPPERVASKLPSFRNADLNKFTGLPVSLGLHGHLELESLANNLPQDRMASDFQVAANNASTHKSPPHHRTQSGTVSSGSPKRQRLPRPLSFPLAPDSPQALESAAYANIHSDLNAEIILPSQPNSLTRASTVGAKPQKARIPASHSRNDLLEESRKEGRNTRRPPAAMITQGSYKIDTTSTSTSTWVASQAQQTITIPSPSQHSQTLPSPAQPTSARSTDTTGSRPLIKPIRGFKPSNRKSTEMALRRTSTNDDNTLRALEGYEPKRRISDPIDPDEPNSDESDMFLRAAREEEMPRQASNGPVETISRSESRRVRHPHGHLQEAILQDKFPYFEVSSHFLRSRKPRLDHLAKIEFLVSDRTTFLCPPKYLIFFSHISTSRIRSRKQCIKADGGARKCRTSPNISPG